jgi:hypothetical protein
MCFIPDYINRHLVSKEYRIYITKFRLCNIRTPIETGRRQTIIRENRKCTKCSKDVIGDEYHYLFICNNTDIQSLRSKYIPKYYVQNSQQEH